MWATWETFYAKYESDHNDLAQYGRRNNFALNGISDSVSSDTVEESVMSVLADTDVFVEYQDIEACHRFGKADRQKSKNTIVQLTNRKICKNILSNKNKLGKIDCKRHNFNGSTKIFANENLTPMNESIVHITVVS